MERVQTTFPLLVVLLIQGCASFSPGQIVKPSEVTLEQALTSLGTGLSAMHMAQAGLRTGLLPAEVTVSFNLGVSANDSSKLTLDFSRASEAAVKVGAEAGLEVEQSSQGSRANAITVKFVNLLTLPESSIVQKKSPAEVQALINALRASGIDIFFVPK
jgi:hypothetical protein